jgi:hypothetical protein
MQKVMNKNIHPNQLIPSTQDDILLCREVERGFNMVFNLYRSQNGEDLPVPPSLDADMFRWRSMAVRFRKGDLRHSEAELKSLKTIAQWTVSLNCKLGNQPEKKLVWK